MTEARLSSPAGLSMTRRMADFMENRARSSVARSSVWLSVSTIRRCSTPAAAPRSVSVGSYAPLARAAVRRTRKRSLQANFAPYFRSSLEARVIPQRVPNGIDLQNRNGDPIGRSERMFDQLPRLIFLPTSSRFARAQSSVPAHRRHLWIPAAVRRRACLHESLPPCAETGVDHAEAGRDGRHSPVIRALVAPRKAASVLERFPRLRFVVQEKITDSFEHSLACRFARRARERIVS